MDRLAFASPDKMVSGTLLRSQDAARGLVVAIHGGGCQSGYFEIAGQSLPAAATTAGLAVLLVNRPGFAGNAPLPPTSDPIAACAGPIARFINQVLAGPVGTAGPLVLLGHSIGGALALDLAGQAHGWPLAGVTASGIGDLPSAAIASWTPEQQTGRDGPDADTAALFLGRPDSYDWRAVIALRRVAEPWNLGEADAMIRRWPARWPDVAAAVRVPVALRLADADAIWETGQPVLDRMAACFTAAPDVTTALLPNGGHLYELTRQGPDLVAAQVRFALDCVAGPVINPRVS